MKKFKLFFWLATLGLILTSQTFAQELRYNHFYKPCRYLDTRSINAPLIASEPRKFQLAFSGNIQFCHLPPTARIAVISIIAINPKGDGHLKAYPAIPVFDSPYRPETSVLNFSTGVTISSQIFVGMSDDKKIVVMSEVSDTDLVIDLVGYFY